MKRGSPDRIAAWRWPLVALACVLLGLVALDRTCGAVREAGQRPADAVREAGRSVAQIAARFRSGNITTTFRAAIPRLSPGGPRLELASFDATESLERSDERSVLFDLLPLGTTVTEIRVPVTYRYHVRLDEPWHLEVRGHDCLVQAPALRPTLPPAIHTETMEKRVERGWLRFDSAEQMETLERSLTPVLSARARDPAHLGMVRETCRRRLAEFVRGWLLREDHWRTDRFSAVTVLFPGESPSQPRAPTLRIESPAADPGASR